MALERLINRYPVDRTGTLDKLSNYLNNKGYIPDKILRRCNLNLLDLISKYQHIDHKIIEMCVDSYIQEFDYTDFCENMLIFKYCSNDQFPDIVCSVVRYSLHNFDYKKCYNMLVQNKYIIKINESFIPIMIIPDNEHLELFKESTKYVEEKKWITDLVLYLESIFNKKN